jgi:tetratricopeptide (TPR) repeat protein/DNA-binding CsgD family transcriptional regulator
MNDLKIAFIVFFCCFALNALPAQQQQTDALLQEIADNAELIAGGEYKEGLENLTQILEYAEKSDNHKVEVLATINIGILYYHLNDLEKALNYYFTALDLAVDYGLEETLNAIYNNIAIVYSDNNEFENAREYFLNALNISKERNDSLRIGINNLNLANLHSDYNRYADARKYIDEAEKIMMAFDQPGLLVPLYNVKGNIYFKEQKFKLAKISQQKALNYLKLHDDVLYETQINIALGRAFHELNQHDSAILHVEKGYALAKQIKNKEQIINSSKLLGELYQAKKMPGESTSYLWEALNWTDSLLSERNQKWVSESQMRYEFEKKEMEISFLESKNKLYLIIWLLSILFLIILGTFIFYFLRNRHIRIRQHHKLLLQEKELHQLELQKTEAENKCLMEEMKANEEKSMLEQEQFKRELELKDRELALNAMHVVNKNSILSDIHDRLSSLECKENRDSEMKIQAIESLIRQNIHFDNDWQTFKLHFEKVHGNFFQGLKEAHQSLSQGDLRLCAYMVINLNPKEIAQILNISPDSVRKRKQRLKEKLSVEKDTDLLGYLETYKQEPVHP